MDPTPRRDRPSPLARAEIERAWIDAAARLGLRVVRTADAYATSDGRGTIAIGVGAVLDVDDAVAQLVFHELCHAITQGADALALPDWGLDNAGPRDVVREHACLRLQAHLADAHGLRALMAPTTEYRAYHDALPEEPLADGDDPAIALAREAAARAAAPQWAAPLAAALAATAALVGRAAHPLGMGLGPADQTCGSCAWLYVGGRGKGVERCRQAAAPNADGPRTRRETPACARWEPPVACETCGACCREAYHSVTVSVRDPVVWKQPDLVERHGHRFEIRRDGERCAALTDRRNDPSRAPSERIFTCSIYEDRPQACRDFAAGGRHCLDARRRVGLSVRG
ncbi:MAG TPA: YkgJ family cysteine cluster protein [Polyangia bacterium]|nr:YkgJ family cysteine cluster protein [Polyangia bacterium]